jgi:transposase
MLRIHLSDEQRTQRQALRQTDLPSVGRTRLEMVFLSDAGWSAPKIARHLGNPPHTVRSALKGFRDRGTAAFQPDKPGPEPDYRRREQVADQLRNLLTRERTWTSLQLAEALRPCGINLSARQVRRHLSSIRAGYRRTAQTVSHKQDPNKVERAKAVLSNLKKKLSRAG